MMPNQRKQLRNMHPRAQGRGRGCTSIQNQRARTSQKKTTIKWIRIIVGKTFL